MNGIDTNPQLVWDSINHTSPDSEIFLHGTMDDIPFEALPHELPVAGLIGILRARGMGFEIGYRPFDLGFFTKVKILLIGVQPIDVDTEPLNLGADVAQTLSRQHRRAYEALGVANIVDDTQANGALKGIVDGFDAETLVLKLLAEFERRLLRCTEASEHLVERLLLLDIQRKRFYFGLVIH